MLKITWKLTWTLKKKDHTVCKNIKQEWLTGGPRPPGWPATPFGPDSPYKKKTSLLYQSLFQNPILKDFILITHRKKKVYSFQLLITFG